ncbi:MAG: ABC transporter ATP-binding protein [Aquabacterium sp.]|nr:ABC transporter ATP-binding protein [Aquabacterium sp.]
MTEPVAAHPITLPHDTEPWLVVDNIALQYGHRTIVKHLSFELPKGTIACLLGPSGCGKTSALRAIAGFEPLTSGQIRLAGRVLSMPGRITPPEKRRIGMVFQDYALFPHLSVADNVGFGLKGQTNATQRVAEVLDLVGLSQSGKRFPHELSGGQQQRVALARALAPQPSILLLDEPFSNLDVALRERLAGEVRDILKRTGTTAVLVTHDQNEAFAMADVIGVLADGQLQQWDSAYSLYHRPANRRVANFVGQGTFIPATVVHPHQLSLCIGQDGEAANTFNTEAAIPFAKGAAVDVLLRPDDVVHDDDSPIKAKVIQKTFRGADFLYKLALASGQHVLSTVPSHHDHAIGEYIGIKLDMSHVVVFEQEVAA